MMSVNWTRRSVLGCPMHSRALVTFPYGIVEDDADVTDPTE